MAWHRRLDVANGMAFRRSLHGILARLKSIAASLAFLASRCIKIIKPRLHRGLWTHRGIGFHPRPLRPSCRRFCLASNSTRRCLR